MPEPEIDLLAVRRGTVTAPAGCGKTHMIAQAITRHGGLKPILVLTHTNAGVAALRSRLDTMGVSHQLYRLTTIDGWAMRLISTFPARSGHDPSILQLRQARSDYLSIRRAASGLLKAGHIDDILASTFDRLIVDEYQDCSVAQHAIVFYAARSLPTCVLGDPLQAIFDFAGALANWQDEVCVHFPLLGELSTPWRWRNAGEEGFGSWLLEVRKLLIAGQDVDLRLAPPNVTWAQLTGVDDHLTRLRAARTPAPTRGGSVLIIGDSTSPRSQQQIASQTPGAITVESVDLRDLVAFAQSFDLRAHDALDRIVNFAETVMTNVGANDMLRRVESLVRGTARNAPTEAEQAALDFKQNPTFGAAVTVLGAISAQMGVRTFRHGILRGCVKSLQIADSPEGPSLYEAAVQVREQSRVLGRPLPKRAVGSTLLLKGLEADAAVILNAAALNRQNTYVAMTRGSRRLVICAPNPVLNPA